MISTAVRSVVYNLLLAYVPPHSSSSLHQQLEFRVLRWALILSIRTVLVLIAWGVAVGIPRFELCLALVGSLATSILAFILPPLFHLALKWRKTHKARNIFHAIILVFGIFATIAATGVNLYQVCTVLILYPFGC